MLIVMVLISFITGVGLSANLGRFLTILVSVFLGVVGMFFGMAMGVVRYRNQEVASQEAMTYLRMSAEMRARNRVRQAVEDTKKECSGFAIESARAVANRVANRIIARHAGALLNDEQREATLEETDQIVEEEIGAFREAISDESEAAKKS